MPARWGISDKGGFQLPLKMRHSPFAAGPLRLPTHFHTHILVSIGQMAETRKTLKNISFLEFSHIRNVYLGVMAERQGFEPWVGLHPQRFSRPPRSTTPAPLRAGVVRRNTQGSIRGQEGFRGRFSNEVNLIAGWLGTLCVAVYGDGK